MHEEQVLVKCPYNSSHFILKHRMASHLIKCRQQYALKDFSICPFNSTHDVPTPELEIHIETCSDRRKLDSFVYVMDDGVRTHEDKNDIVLPPSSENWDEEATQTVSYLDKKAEIITKQPLFRVPVNMSKSEKKKFWKEEVERFENISSKNRKKDNKHPVEGMSQN